MKSDRVYSSIERRLLRSWNVLFGLGLPFGLQNTISHELLEIEASILQSLDLSTCGAAFNVARDGRRFKDR
jgi:hypothetical protein